MAKAVINLQKESGGIVKISPVDGTGVTELIVPERGTVSSVDTAVTNNAVARYDGTTGKLQDSGVIIDDNGNVGIGNISDNNARRLGFTTAGGGSSAIESVTIGSTHQELVFKTTYATESEKMRLTGPGNLLLTSGTGALGYGTGAGGTVTQLTSKSASVTLNKPSGRITMHNEALAAGASVYFAVNNSLVTPSDHIILTMGGSTTNLNYTVFPSFSINSGVFYIIVKNISAGSLSEALVVNFSIIKGANS